MSHRAICVTASPALRKVLRRSLCAAGTEVEFVDDCSGMLGESEEPPSLVLVDHQVECPEIETLPSKLDPSAHMILLGAAVDSEKALKLLRHERCDHLLGVEAKLDEEEMVVTAVKLLHGDIFGPEKYLTWGVRLEKREIASYDDKRVAMREVTDFARTTGCRRQLVARIETVTDELLMNALYDAPAMRYGSRPRFQRMGRPGAGPVTDEHALLRYGCDGKHFALAVQDNYGELRKANIIDHLERAQQEQGVPHVDMAEGGGGGLGLYFILNSVTRFIANIDPGRTTEVICLFDMRSGARDYHYQARSLSIFTSGSATPCQETGTPEPSDEVSSSAST